MTFKVKDGLSVSGNTILDGSGNLTLPAGSKATLSNTSSSGASLNLGTGNVDPTSPVAGDFWNNTGVLKIRQAAATKTIAYTDSTITGNAANVTGLVAIANGGTNSTATPTNGGIVYGDGSAHAITAAGTSGQYLVSSGSGVPVWTTPPTAIANATNITITDDVATATSQYLYFGSATSGNTGVKSSSSRLTFVPSTGNLTTIGSVSVGGNGVIYSGSTSGSTTVRASAIAGSTTITLPSTTGTVVTTGDTGTITSTMILDGTIVNADINASAAIAVSKLAASTISGITLGSNLFSLTLGTGLTGSTYNGSAAVTATLGTSGVTAGTYGSSTAIPVIAVDTYGRITTASTSTITVNAGSLSSAATSNTGATATTVALNFSGAYDANTVSNVTIAPVIGPSLSALAATMTGASTGILSKTAADTYALVSNAPTATKLASATTIQGISFDGSAAITPVSAGTGVSFTGAAGTTQVINIGQAVATSSDVRFGSIGVGVAASGVSGTITATSINKMAITAPATSSTLAVADGKTFTVNNSITLVGTDATTITLPSTTGTVALNNQTFFIGTTSVTINRPSANLALTGITSIDGSAATLTTARNINGVPFNGSLDITVTAAAGTLTGTTLNSTVTASSLTSVGTLTSLAVTGAITGTSFNSITGLSSTTPVVAGTAAVGTGTTTARADHVHPAQTTISGNAGTVTNGVYTNVANTLTASLTISNTAPIINLFETDQTLPAGRRRIVLDGNVFSIRRNTAAGGDFSTEVNDIVSDATGNFTSSGNITAYSDIRLKKDLVQIPDALSKVQQLTGYTYTRIDTGEKQTGLVAQDVQKVLPEAVIDGDNMSVAYGNLVGLLVEAIKELRAEVASLKENKP